MVPNPKRYQNLERGRRKASQQPLEKTLSWGEKEQAGKLHHLSSVLLPPSPRTAQQVSLELHQLFHKHRSQEEKKGGREAADPGDRTQHSHCHWIQPFHSLPILPLLFAPSSSFLYLL